MSRTECIDTFPDFRIVTVSDALSYHQKVERPLSKMNEEVSSRASLLAAGNGQKPPSYLTSAAATRCCPNAAHCPPRRRPPRRSRLLPCRCSLLTELHYSVMKNEAHLQSRGQSNLEYLIMTEMRCIDS